MTTALSLDDHAATPSCSCWIDDLSRHRRRGGDPRVRQVDLGIGRAHPPAEVAVRRRDRPLSCRQHPHAAAETRSAGRCRHHRAGARRTCRAGPPQRLPVDPLGRRHDDHAAVGMDGCPLAPRPSGEGRSSSRSNNFRCRPGRSAFRPPPRNRHDVPGQMGKRDQRRKAERSMRRTGGELSVGIGALRRPWPFVRPSR